MLPRRPFTLPVDPWPQAALAERLSVTVVLMMLLVLPFCAIGAVMALAGALTLHVYRSYDLGASLRVLIDRGTGRGGVSGGGLAQVDVPAIGHRQTT